MAKRYSHNGFAGCVTQRRTRKGQQVGLYHAEQAGIDADTELPWVTVCEEHGCLLSHPSLAMAKSWLPHPEEWCEDCREKMDSFEPVEPPYPDERHQRGAEVAQKMLEQVAAGKLDEADCENLKTFWKRKDFDHTKPITEKDFESVIDIFAIRTAYVSRLFCLATKQWMDSIEKLVRGKRVVEICAGHGIIALAMQRRGLDWIATDLKPPKTAKHRVKKLDAREVKTLEPDVIFVSWPPLGDPLDQDVAALGIPMIMVGEYAGCTGTEEFFDEYKVKAASKVYEDFNELPSFDCINDFTMLVNWPED